MSRSGYCDDYDIDDPLELGRWRGVVASSIRGRRGQAFLREMLAALDAMPEKRLGLGELVQPETPVDEMPPGVKAGDVCAMGSVGRARGIDMSKIDPYEAGIVAHTFDISEPLAREISYVNDDYRNETPEQRWVRVRKWVAAHIKIES